MATSVTNDFVEGKPAIVNPEQESFSVSLSMGTHGGENWSGSWLCEKGSPVCDDFDSDLQALKTDIQTAIDSFNAKVEARKV